MNAHRAVALVVCFAASISAAIAQARVDPWNTYERVIAIVPMIGTGTEADPVRPMYTPVISDTAPLTSTPFLGFTMVQSDDGKFALVEFVARSKTPFRTILADATIQTFLKGTNSRQAAEAAFQKLKKGFSIQNFGVRVP
ncbi:MAG TPA: hypothetical protein VMH80_08015 [Bryobacteraceae bacterium]|nr:hypothetical protein [Bryobacteraceae bacterium]